MIIEFPSSEDQNLDNETIDKAISFLALESITSVAMDYSTLGKVEISFYFQDPTVFPLGAMSDFCGVIFQIKSSGTSTVIDQPPSAEDYKNNIVSLMADKTRQFGYDSILSACSYVNSEVPKFDREARAFFKWRDHLWIKAFEIGAEATASGVWPSIIEMTDQLPLFETILESIDD